MGKPDKRSRNRSPTAQNNSYSARSQEAENNLAAAANEHRNQKGHMPNNPSTG